MASEQVAAEDSFVPAFPRSEWYKNLKRRGSCLRLYGLLAGKGGEVGKPELVHELGPEGITVLHKGVDHGCVKLVRFILVDMFDGDGKCTCILCGAENPSSVLTREGLLRKTSEYGSTAVNMAVVSGSPKMVLLLKWAIDESNRCKNRGLADGDSSQGDEIAQLYGYLPTIGRRVRNWEKSESAEEVATEITNDAGVHSKVLNREKAESAEEDAAEIVNDGGVCSKVLNREKSGSAEEKAPDISNDGGVRLEIPDVKDDAIGKNIYGTVVSDMILKVYEIIEEKLNEDWGDDQELVNMLKDKCNESVDFGFVPVAHVFLHFLFSFSIDTSGIRKKFMMEILVACNKRDLEEGNNTSMLVTLFPILDPRGRTILTTAFQTSEEFPCWVTVDDVIRILEKLMSPSTRIGECVNAKEGAGRTIFHLASIYDRYYYHYVNYYYSDVGLPVSPLCEELQDLKEWCFRQHSKHECEHGLRPSHSAVIFNSIHMLECILAFKGVVNQINDRYIPRAYDILRISRPFQMAAFLGRVTIVEHFLKVSSIIIVVKLF